MIWAKTISMGWELRAEGGAILARVVPNLRNPCSPFRYLLHANDTLYKDVRAAKKAAERLVLGTN